MIHHTLKKRQASFPPQFEEIPALLCDLRVGGAWPSLDPEEKVSATLAELKAGWSYALLSPCPSSGHFLRWVLLSKPHHNSLNLESQLLVCLSLVHSFNGLE